MTIDTAPTPAPATGSSGIGKDGTRRPGIFSRIRTYYREIINELRKVIYPSRQQLVTYTIVVLVFVSVITAFVSGLDYGLSKAVVALFG